MSKKLKNLVKQWDSATLELLWYSPKPKVKLESFTIHNSPLTIPDSLKFSFDVVSEEKQNLIIDYKSLFYQQILKANTKGLQNKKITSSNSWPPKPSTYESISLKLWSMERVFERRVLN